MKNTRLLHTKIMTKKNLVSKGPTEWLFMVEFKGSMCHCSFIMVLGYE